MNFLPWRNFSRLTELLLLKFRNIKGHWSTKEFIHIAHSWYFDAVPFRKALSSTRLQAMTLEEHFFNPDILVVRGAFIKKNSADKEWAESLVKMKNATNSFRKRCEIFLFRKFGIDLAGSTVSPRFNKRDIK